jgi:thiamine-phosphate pyrophosphorylase
VSRPEETIDPAEAGCQLLLIGPARLDPASFPAQLDAVLAVGAIAGFVLHPGVLEAAQEGGPRLAGRLRAICADHGIAFLLRGQVAAALEIGADGVHVGIAADVAASRAALDAERILGVSCGHSRDAAMVAGEAGADYVGFGDLDCPAGPKLYDLLEWWSELFLLPCLAEAATTERDCGRLARAGADFVAAGGTVWADPRGTAPAVRRLRDALDAA